MAKRTRIAVPVDTKQFRFYWEIFLPHLKSRNNFNKLYLKNLEILCQLYVTYDELMEELSLGTTYTSDGRNGLQIKTKPEVLQKDKALDQILKYTNILNISIEPEIPTDPEELENKEAGKAWG